MVNSTEYGLLLIIIAVGIGILSSVLSLFSNGLIDIGSISLILLIIGIVLMFVGRKEYGEKHQRNVVLAGIIFLISFIATIVFVIFAIFSVYSSESFDGLKTLFYVIPIAAFFDGLVYILLVYSLENSVGKKILFSAFIVSVTLALIVFVFFIPTVESFIDDMQEDIENQDTLDGYTYYGEDYSSNFEEEQIEYEDKISNMQSEASKYGALGIFGQILFLIALYIPYKRIKNGEIQQKLPGHLKRCMNCGRVNPGDAIICAFCGNHFNNFL